jgi:predicted ferric reductase
MALKKEGYVFLAAVVAFAVVVSVVSYSVAFAHPFDLSMRLFALNGFLMLSVATMITPFLSEVKNTFGRPFMVVHHSFAAVGIVLVTLHPVTFAVQVLDATVFLPSFQSWYSFWVLGGRQALIVFYVALVAALVRRRIPSLWRSFHALMYVVLFFAIVHGNLLGIDFDNPFIFVVFDALFATAIGTFVLKRVQLYRRRRSRRLKS